MALISKKTASRVPGSRFCPRSHLKTGIGVSILPEGAYAGTLRPCPPACSSILFSFPAHSARLRHPSGPSALRHDSSSHVVPPPEPRRVPEGSQQQNHSSGLCFVISWKQPTRLGGRESNFFIVAGLCFTTGKDKQIYRYFFFPSASMNFRKYSFSSSLSTDCASLPSSSYRILR